MVFQITCKNVTGCSDTRDIGYLLHKNPNNFLTTDLKFGKAHVFYTKATENETTMNMILDIDSLELSKSNYGYSGMGLFEYVNDGGFATNSFMAAAIKKVFNTAIGGSCREKEGLLINQPGDIISVSLHGIRCSEVWAEKYFGYITEMYNDSCDYKIYYTGGEDYVDSEYEEFGENPYLDITVSYSSEVKLAYILRQIYIFIMTCVYKSHSYMDKKDEFVKFHMYTTPWINRHPYRNNIISRYFSGIENYYKEYLDEYYPRTNKMLKEIEEERAARPETLGSRRRSWVRYEINEILENVGTKNIKSITEIGCSEGKQIYDLIKDPHINIQSYRGLEINPGRIEKANKLLAGYDNCQILEGNILYRDDRLLDTDILLAIEVIEHIDRDKLELFCENVFNYIKPKFVILTTPNIEYNKYFENPVPEGKFRHSDHRFEFNRREMIEFALAITRTYDYRLPNKAGSLITYEGIGDSIYTHGVIYPTFGVVFIREDLYEY